MCERDGTIIHFPLSIIHFPPTKLNLITCSLNYQLDEKFSGRLGDFGISKALGTCGVATAVGSGTFTHIAPEEILEVGNQIDPLAAEVYRCVLKTKIILRNEVKP